MHLPNEITAPLGEAEDFTIYKFGQLPIEPRTKRGKLALAKFNEIVASMGDSQLNEAATLALSGLSRTTMHRKIAAGKFPAPVKIDGWHVAWQRCEVEDWLLTQAVAQDAAMLPDAAVADLLALASSCDPALLGRLFPCVASVMGRAA